MNSRRYSRLLRPVGYDAAEGENHPMLLHGAGIATIAAACTSGVNALALSVIMLLLCVAMSVIYMYERGEYIQPMRSVVYFVPSALLACGCGLLLNAVAPSAAAAIGLYLPVAAADSLVLARLQADSPFVPPSESLPEAMRLWWLYALMALPIGLLREAAGNGTVFGLPFLFRLHARGTERPFMGLLLLGFGLALYRSRRSEKAVPLRTRLDGLKRTLQKAVQSGAQKRTPRTPGMRPGMKRKTRPFF